MILSEQEKNRIRGLHREGSIIKEQQGPPGPGGYAGGTPCYACIGNHIVTMLFPSSALGQPHPDCAPTAYGYQGQTGGLPGGAASYAYPSIWSEVQPTNCGGSNSGDWWCDPTGAYQNPNGGNCAQSINQPQSYFTGPYSTQQECDTQCGSSTPAPSCNKDCAQLVPGSFSNLMANKPCNWLNNRYTAFYNKLSTPHFVQQEGSCQYKRIQCKLGMVNDRRVQLGC